MANYVSFDSMDFDAPYPAGYAVGPTGPAVGLNRVIRGGAWDCPPSKCRAALRGNSYPSERYTNVGFRLVRVA